MAVDAHLLVSEAVGAGVKFMIDGDRVGLRGDPARVAEFAQRMRPYRNSLLQVLRERGLAAHKAWRVCVPGRPEFGLICVQGCTRDELLAHYPAGTLAESIR